MLLRCLKKNPEERATSAELMEHEWVRDEIAALQMGKVCAATKAFFDENIEAVVRMRNGEDDPAEDTVAVSGVVLLGVVFEGL